MITKVAALGWVTSQKSGLDWDGKYGCQCVDLIRFYTKKLELPQFPALGIGGAKDWATKQIPAGWTRITDKNAGQAGDVAIFGGGLYGHTSVLITDVQSGVFKSVDQNWVNYSATQGSPPKVVAHDLSRVLCYYRPSYEKEAIPITNQAGGTNVAEKITVDTSRIISHGVLARNGLAGRGSSLGGDNGGDGWVGQDLSNKLIQQLFLSPEGRQWRDSQDGNSINGINARLSEAEQLKKDLADALASRDTTQKQLADLQAKLDDANKRLEQANQKPTVTFNDTKSTYTPIISSSTASPETVKPVKIKGSLLVRLLAFFMRKK